MWSDVGSGLGLGFGIGGAGLCFWVWVGPWDPMGFWLNGFCLALSGWDGGGAGLTFDLIGNWMGFSW